MAALRFAAAALLAIAAPARADGVDRWSALISEASRRFAVPEAWIRHVMHAESGGEPTSRGRPVVSRAGAMGLMQLMPRTWREVRAAHSLGDDPFEPRDNILAGTAYLRAMYDQFGYPGMFAAYNAGPARYAEHLARRRRLPRETLAYVAKVAPGTSVALRAQPGLHSPPTSPLFALGAVSHIGSIRPTATTPEPSIFVPLAGSRSR